MDACLAVLRSSCIPQAQELFAGTGRR